MHIILNVDGMFKPHHIVVHSGDIVDLSNNNDRDMMFETVHRAGKHNNMYEC